MFESGEVTALIQLVPVDDVGILALSPASRAGKNLLRENAAADGDVDGLGGKVAEALPIEPGRRGAGAGEPAGACDPDLRDEDAGPGRAALAGGGADDGAVGGRRGAVCGAGYGIT